MRPLAVTLLFLALAAGIFGCGGKPDDRRDKLPAEQRVLDVFLYGIVESDPAAVLSALPPAWVEEVRGDMQTTDEELGTVIMEALRFEFPYTAIEEISYFTEEKEDSSVDVYYWGVFEETDASGKTRKVTLSEAESRSFNLVGLDGSWYLDV